MRNLHAFELRQVTGAGRTDAVRCRTRHYDGNRTRLAAIETPADPAGAAAAKPQPPTGGPLARDHR